MGKGHDKGHKGQMSDREVMKLALEALGDIHPGNMTPMAEEYWGKAITAIRQALDHVPDTTKMIEPDMGIDRGAWDDVPDATKWVDELRGDDTEQEPVAWLDVDEYEAYSNSELDEEAKKDLTPLYTAPPRREWVGLTDDETDILITLHAPPIHPDFNDDDDFIELVSAIEAKLKEKNT